MPSYVEMNEVTRAMADEDKVRKETAKILAFLAAIAVVGLALAYHYLT